MDADRDTAAGELAPGVLRVIEAAPGRPPWRLDAGCLAEPPAMFYPHAGESAAPAKAVCGECRVAEECLAWAIRTGEQQGIWGGLTYRERNQLLAERGERFTSCRRCKVGMVVVRGPGGCPRFCTAGCQVAALKERKRKWNLSHREEEPWAEVG